MPTAAKFDVKSLRTGHEQHDLEAITGLYAEDAESITVDATNPPSKPRKLSGKEEITELWKDIFSRDMTHKVQKVVEGDDSVAYQVACRYDDGSRVLALVLCELEGGRISRETIVQAWDS